MTKESLLSVSSEHAMKLRVDVFVREHWLESEVFEKNE